MAESLTDRYGKRLDDFLPTLPDDAARRSFLEGQQLSFERAYLAFQHACADGTHRGPETAADYLLTIIEIGRRIDALPKREAA